MIFKRPWLVLLLFACALLFMISAWARVWNGWHFRDFLGGLGLVVSPWYVIISGALWGVYGIFGVVILWVGWPKTPVVVTGGVVLYSINFWIEQVLLMVSPLRGVNWPFLVLSNLIIVVAVMLIFRHPRVRRFYGGRHE